MKPASLHTLLTDAGKKVLLCDYFDTVVHRRVHPNYTQRIWAKLLIQELGLSITIDSLYFIRRESAFYLKRKLGVYEIEVPYHLLQKEIVKRLVNNLIIREDQRESFLEYFELADIRSEIIAQYLNPDVVDLLTQFRSAGGKIYLVSDFYAPVSIFKTMLIHHGIYELFDGVFTSSELEKSKQRGNIYQELIENLALDPKTVLMIGDNNESDITNAKKAGLNAKLMPHQKALLKNKIRGVGSDDRNYKRFIDAVYKECNSSSSPALSEYVLFFIAFIERLYKSAKRLGIKNLFFVSREGQYLKKLFDHYQLHHTLNKDDHIETHYLKMSRHSALQILLKPLNEESFQFLRKRFPTFSIRTFLNMFFVPIDIISQIENQLAFDPMGVHADFFNTEEFQALIANDLFKTHYEINRGNQKLGFKAYIRSFDVDIHGEGMHVVDVGWGGSMQEAIYNVFNRTFPVQGFYLGLREIYNITKDTKRYGLLFSVQPFEIYSDHILSSNTQLYEQLLTAGHGGASGYQNDPDNFVLESVNQDEQDLYENRIAPIQEFMFSHYKQLLKELDLLCYDYNLVQRNMTRLALKTGLLVNNRKLKLISELSTGFVQNVGNKQVGMRYNMAAAGSKKQLIKDFLIQPESVFRFLVKLKPVFYQQNKIIRHFIPTRLIYYYILFNRFVRERYLKRRFFLKYNYFK